jgi:hypothetical protein
MKRTPWKVEELVRAYDLMESGASYGEIAQETGRTTGAVRQMIGIAKAGVRGESQKQTPKAAKKAIRIIRKRDSLVTTAEPSPADPYEKLKEAQVVFNQAMTDFIQTIVDNKVGEVKRENQKLKAELGEYKEAMEETKNYNWIDSLRNKYQG